MQVIARDNDIFDAVVVGSGATGGWAAKQLTEAGAKVVFIPRGDTPTSFESWREHVAEVVAWGLDAETALRAITLEPAALLGIDDRVGSIEAGKQANMVFLSGDPFEVGTRVEAVMLDGEMVFEEEEQ